MTGHKKEFYDTIFRNTWGRSTSDFGQFVEAYVEAMLWSSTDDDGVPLDDRYDFHSFTEEAYATILTDCQAFWQQITDSEGNISSRYDNALSKNVGQRLEYSFPTLAGHDFWLTRNHHGTGFWESGRWEDDCGEELNAIAKKFREQSPCIGDDGLIYLA